MKKQTLLAAALLCAAFSAAASDIEVYGVLDYGLTWQDRTNADGSDSAALQMTSGQYIGSLFGIKGTETLANGLKVGFVLENGFGADTGSLGQNGRLFGRDARLFLDGSFGYLSFGRMGSMATSLLTMLSPTRRRNGLDLTPRCSTPSVPTRKATAIKASKGSRALSAC